MHFHAVTLYRLHQIQLPEFSQLQSLVLMSQSERHDFTLNVDPATYDILKKLNMGQTVRGYSADQSGVLYYQATGTEQRIVVPTNKQQRILEEHHDVPTVGHLGVERILEMIQRVYWWKGIRQSVKEYIRTCPKCQMFKSENQAPKGLRQAIPIPTTKWEQITTDFGNGST